MQVSNTEEPSPQPEPADPLSYARGLVAEAVGDVMGFWNFRPSMGRVWACLYLSPRPLTSAEIVEETGLSVGMVSMTLQELRRWGVVQDSGRSGGRRCFEAETDLFKMVTRVVRERELSLVTDTVEKLDRAVKILDEHGRSSVPSKMLESRFVVTRARRLLGLARSGHQMIDRFTRVGRIDLSMVRDKLSRRG